MTRVISAADAPPRTVSGRARWRNVAVAALAVLAATVVGLLRQPGIGPLDTIWAEDGQVFLTEAARHNLFHALATPYAGYYQLVPRLLAQLTTALPAGWAAAAFAIESALCTGLVMLLVYVASGAHLRSTLSRVVVAAIVVVMPLANEIPDSIANLHWAGLYAMFWVLLWTPRGSAGAGAGPGGTAGRIVAAAVVLLVAGSDILVLIYLPLALWQVRRQRDRHSIVLAGLLSLGVAVQLAGLVFGPSSRPLSPNPVPVVTGYVLRVVPSALVGERWLGTDTHSTRWLALAAVAWLLLAAAAVVAWRRSTRPIWRLAILALLYSAGLYALPVVLQGIATPRYAAVPVMLLVTAIVAVFQPGSGSRVPLYALTALLAVVCVANLRVLDNSRGSGPRWSDSLQSARITCQASPGGTASLLIPPREAVPQWHARLPCRYVRR
jgi:hypothetical protein